MITKDIRFTHFWVSIRIVIRMGRYRAKGRVKKHCAYLRRENRDLEILGKFINRIDMMGKSKVLWRNTPE